MRASVGTPSYSDGRGSVALRSRTSIVLHHREGRVVLFTGTHGECPPVPRTGDCVRFGGVSLRIEGVEFNYTAGGLTVDLLC